ncbi:MAG: lipid II:glycine glycyltransferase FemX [Treponema sp.]
MYTVELKQYHHTVQQANSFLQTEFWAAFKSLHGWQPLHFEAVINGSSSFLLTVLLKPIKPFGSIAYVPMGPAQLTDTSIQTDSYAAERGQFLCTLIQQLQRQLPHEVFLIRFDPPWETRIENTKEAAHNTPDSFPLFPCIPKHTAYSKGFYAAPYTVQPPDTVVLDLTAHTDALLAQFKQKWRYNIRLAEKKGVTVCRFSGKEAAAQVPLFYRLYEETAARDGIAIHAQSYYESLCMLAADYQTQSVPVEVSMYAAYHEDEALAAIITLFLGHEAVYLYGASSNSKRNMMPAYLLQWHAICDAKNFGCRIYDFYGIPPNDDPSHPMHGLYRFKTGFGGMIVHRVGTLDNPVKPLRYCAYTAAERIRTFWFKTIKKKLKDLFRQPR